MQANFRRRREEAYELAKSNSGTLRGRVWRCAHGVAAVNVYDTYFRARIGAWMDQVKEAWM
jgi:hypothetical protein